MGFASLFALLATLPLNTTSLHASSLAVSLPTSSTLNTKSNANMVLTRGQIAIQQGAEGASICRLPGEVIHLILCSVEEPAAVSSFSLTSKGMLSVANDAALMAQWLFQHRGQASGYPALWLAARKMRSSEVMVRLLHMGVSPTAKTGVFVWCHYSPIGLASVSNFPDVVAHLWHMQEVRDFVDDAVFALTISVQAGHTEILQILLTPPSPLTTYSKDTRGWYPLHSAAYYCNSVEAVALLLSPPLSASVTLRSHNGRTPLHFCCSQHDHADTRAKVLQMLINAPHGMSILDARDDNGNTALHFAAREGLIGCMQILLRAGTKAINARTNAGNTPFQWAKGSVNFNNEVLEVLLEAGAKLS